MTLTPAMRETLERAKAQDGLRRVFEPGKPGKPPWPAHPNTINALTARGYLERTERYGRVKEDGKRNLIIEWAITDAGREALDPPRRVLRASRRPLRVPGGTTRFMQAGEWVERPIPEPDQMTPGPDWAVDSRARHVDASDRRERARRVAARTRAA